MRLFDFLREQCQSGIQYEDAVELCLAIYSSSDILPDVVQKDDLSMDTIAEAFAASARLGLIKDYASYKAIPYGANYHLLAEKGHWIEIQASLLKSKTSYDLNRVKTLLRSPDERG